jgi:tetratricopeptide (TPR) repeat protein
MKRNQHRPLVVALILVLTAMSFALSGCGSDGGNEDSADSQQGRELYDAGEFDEAIALLNEVLEEDPEDLEARKTLALALAATGDLDGAIAEYETVIAAEPDDYATLYRLGLLERQAGDSANAAERLGRAAELHSDDPSYWDEYAKTLVQLGRYYSVT